MLLVPSAVFHIIINGMEVELKDKVFQKGIGKPLETTATLVEQQIWVIHLDF